MVMQRPFGWGQLLCLGRHAHEPDIAVGHLGTVARPLFLSFLIMLASVAVQILIDGVLHTPSISRSSDIGLPAGATLRSRGPCVIGECNAKLRYRVRLAICENITPAHNPERANWRI